METGCPRVVGRVFDGKLQDALRNVVWSFLRIPEELVIAMGGGRPQVSMQFPAGLGRRRPGEEGQLGWHSGYLPSGVHRPWLPPLRGPQPRERRERHGEESGGRVGVDPAPLKPALLFPETRWGMSL